MNRIKIILTEQGRSQRWLSEKINRSYPAVTLYCNNKVQPSLSILFRIAEVLEVDIRILLNHQYGEGSSRGPRQSAKANLVEMTRMNSFAQ